MSSEDAVNLLQDSGRDQQLENKDTQQVKGRRRATKSAV